MFREMVRIFEVEEVFACDCVEQVVECLGVVSVDGSHEFQGVLGDTVLVDEDVPHEAQIIG